MITELKQFIEDNIDLIDDNDFTELYNRCRDDDRGKLTDVLYECGIDPLQYMTTVPTWFAYRANITNITIPNNVKSISYHSFSWCEGLTSITISDSVTSIRDYAFEGCSELTSITFRANSQLKIIGDHAFSLCDRLTSITIPDNVKIIDYSAFYNCSSLTSISIPDSVTTIREHAFEDCGNLQITYSGTKQQWKHLVTGWKIFPKTTYVCNCLDGTVEKKRG